MTRRLLGCVFGLILLAHPLLADDASDQDLPRPEFTSAERARKLSANVDSGYIVLLNSKTVVASAYAAFTAAHPRSSSLAAATASEAVTSLEAGAASTPTSAAAQVSDEAQKRFSEHAAILQEVVGGGATSTAPFFPLSASAAPSSSARPAGPRMLQQFAYVANGFSVAGLSEEQVARLRARPDVKSVTRNAFAVPLTVTTPNFLGLAGPGNVWEKEFGGPRAAGAGVLIGVIDTGTTPSSVSFASAAAGGSPAGSAVSYDLDSSACSEPGTCTAGKLVACRAFQQDFVASFAGDPAYAVDPKDLSSCTDYSGHGTHTTSTAGGDFGVLAVSNQAKLSEGGMSGMAPGAGVASYKALWFITDKSNNDTFPTGTSGDIVAAIEKAVLDGVDVLSLSLGFGDTPAFHGNEPLYEAFRGAAVAGVFIAAAAGNSGNSAGTVENNLPFITTVAAGSHDRDIVATATVNGAEYVGASSTLLPAGPAGVYYAGDADATGSLCIGGTLTSAAAGKIVLCKRGQNDRVAKSREVLRAGGVGMVLFNVAGGLTNLEPDDHSVPTVHLSAEDGAAVLASYLAAPATSVGAVSARRIVSTKEAPLVAAFSSRGPAAAEKGALLKPDIMAPGVAVFAAAPRDSQSNNTGQTLSGTSMATPHIAGIAALIRAKHPTWGPMAVKSAMMTSASQVTNKGNPIDGTPFAYGAGHIDPARALNPGLVYDSQPRNWDIYTCAASPFARSAACKALCKPAKLCSRPQALRDFNTPSFSFPNLTCTQRRVKVTAKRTVAFAGTGAATFSAKFSLPPLFTASVKVAKVGRGKAAAQTSKTQLQVKAAGDKRDFTVTLVAGPKAPLGWSFGSLVWTDSGGVYTVRTPIAIQCV